MSQFGALRHLTNDHDSVVAQVEKMILKPVYDTVVYSYPYFITACCAKSLGLLFPESFHGRVRVMVMNLHHSRGGCLIPYEDVPAFAE